MYVLVVRSVREPHYQFIHGPIGTRETATAVRDSWNRAFRRAGRDYVRAQVVPLLGTGDDVRDIPWNDIDRIRAEHEARKKGRP